jgi:hypothetical protein
MPAPRSTSITIVDSPYGPPPRRLAVVKSSAQSRRGPSTCRPAPLVGACGGAQAARSTAAAMGHAGRATVAASFPAP